MSESNEQDYMQSGQEALAAGEYNTAQVFFKQAIRVNNANEEAWILLAKTYPTEPDKARKCYENVLKINPLNAEAQRMIDRIDASAAPSTSTNFAPRLMTSSFTAGRVSNTSTTAPSLRAVATA